MRNITVLLTAFLIISSASASDSMEKFLKDCGYGILIGAGAGIIVMSVKDQPSEHTKDVAKGASLGLYAGLIYSYYDLTSSPQNRLTNDLSAKREAQEPTLSSRILPTLAFAKDNFTLGAKLSF